jgi:hypothetical protein
VRRCEDIPGARVLDDVRASVDRWRAGACGRGSDEGERDDEQQLSHLMRTFSPMKSDVDVTFGFNLWILATGTPVLLEITPNVSPARTFQYSRLFAVVEI